MIFNFFDFNLLKYKSSRSSRIVPRNYIKEKEKERKKRNIVDKKILEINIIGQNRVNSRTEFWHVSFIVVPMQFISITVLFFLRFTIFNEFWNFFWIKIYIQLHKFININYK